MRGETIVRTQTLEREDRRYVGGVTYAVVDASADEVSALVDDAAAWQRILPRTRSARRVGAAGGDVLVEVTQGTTLLSATYTIRVHRDGDTIRFWLDPSRDHGIEDAWGYLRAQPVAGSRRTLVTWGVLVDVGDGIVRDLFEDRIRALALTVPDRVRDWALRRRAGRDNRRASL